MVLQHSNLVRYHVYLVLTVWCDCIYIWSCTYYMWYSPPISGPAPPISGCIRSNPRSFPAFSTAAVLDNNLFGILCLAAHQLYMVLYLLYTVLHLLYMVLHLLYVVLPIYIWFCSNYIWSYSLQSMQFSSIFHGSRYILASQWSVWRLYAGCTPAIHGLIPVISGFAPTFIWFYTYYMWCYPPIVGTFLLHFAMFHTYPGIFHGCNRGQLYLVFVRLPYILGSIPIYIWCFTCYIWFWLYGISPAIPGAWHLYLVLFSFFTLFDHFSLMETSSLALVSVDGLWGWLFSIIYRVYWDFLHGGRLTVLMAALRISETFSFLTLLIGHLHLCFPWTVLSFNIII